MEETLSQEASPASLDKFLPRIRDIIITLLHGLKRKQQRLRAKQVKDTAANGTTTSSTPSSSSLNTGLTQMLEDVPSRKSGNRGVERRTGSGGSNFTVENNSGESLNGDESGMPPRFSSIPPTRTGSGSGDAAIRNSIREGQRTLPASHSDSSMSSATSQSTSVLSPTSDGEAAANQIHQAPRLASQFQAPPPPPPKQQDALAALQRGGDLERRASRRYSAYQISKHLGASPNGVPMLPPTQNTPIPNRGRDVRDSMNAVRTRGSGIYSRQKSDNRTTTPSPVRNNALSNRISEESSRSRDSRGPEHPEPEVGNPPAFSSDETAGTAEKRHDLEEPKMKATLSSPLDGLSAYSTAGVEGIEPVKRQRQMKPEKGNPFQMQEDDQIEQQFIPEQSPQPGKELTLFLQYKSKIKKFVLPEGSTDLSVARLQLAFIEKFAWNTHNNGNDLPEIYIQDPVSGVRHELEDLGDVKDRSVLVLNIEALDEVKRHIDDGLGGLKKLVEGVRNVVDGQQSALQRFSDHQQDTVKETARLSVTSKSFSPSESSFGRPKVNGILSSTASKAPADQTTQIQNLRQDLAVVRQTFSSLVSEMNTSMSAVKENASSVKTLAIEGIIPDLDTSTGRSYVNTGKRNLGEESEKIVNTVDDLQDIVEDLRKDVVMRGVRPLPRQLETVGKSISSATSELKKMQQYLKREKPLWTRIWEKELELVCNDRDLLTMQEELAADLEDDLDKATQTFALVEQATKQQNIQSGQGNGVALRSALKGLATIATDQDIDPMKAKDGVLGEVRALRPNHETRIEAIERAEKARQRELEIRKEGEFTKEVASFVEEGRLKKSGGVEETERLRKVKDEKNRLQAWDVQQGRIPKNEQSEIAASIPDQSDSTAEETAPLESEHRPGGLAHEDANSEEEAERLIIGK